MKLSKLTVMLMLFAVILLVAPATFAAEMEEAEAACAEAANAGFAAVAAAALLVPSGIVALRRRLRQK